MGGFEQRLCSQPPYLTRQGCENITKFGFFGNVVFCSEERKVDSCTPAHDLRGQAAGQRVAGDTWAKSYTQLHSCLLTSLRIHTPTNIFFFRGVTPAVLVVAAASLVQAACHRPTAGTQDCLSRSTLRAGALTGHPMPPLPQGSAATQQPRHAANPQPQATMVLSCGSPAAAAKSFLCKEACCW